MPNESENKQTSPFEIVTPGKSKKIGKTGIIVAVLVFVFLILSVVAGVLLVRQQQQIAEKAQVTTNMCPDAEACPFYSTTAHQGDGTILRNCHPAQSDGTPKESICNAAGRVAPCGPAQTQYCCPAAGSAWTTDMTVCNFVNATPSPTPVPTVTPTPTEAAAATLPTDTPWPTDTPITQQTSPATTAPLVQTTPRPIPVTGVSWPTVAGIGAGAAAVIVAILAAI